MLERRAGRWSTEWRVHVVEAVALRIHIYHPSPSHHHTTKSTLIMLVCHSNLDSRLVQFPCMWTNNYCHTQFQIFHFHYTHFNRDVINILQNNRDSWEFGKLKEKHKKRSDHIPIIHKSTIRNATHRLTAEMCGKPRWKCPTVPREKLWVQWVGHH